MSSGPAFLFPGQGSQHVGMGSALSEAFTSARQVWEEADSLLPAPISTLAFNGPEEDLRRTRNAQLALFTSEVAVLRTLAGEGVAPAFTAGHSIGEYAALVAAGVLSFEEGLRLVQARARAMDRAAEMSPGAMAAVLGLPVEQVGGIVAGVLDKGPLVIANYNAPGQIVISGSTEAVREGAEGAAAAGARRVVALAVSGGFHSPLMQSAAEEMAVVVGQAAIAEPVMPVVMNVTAEFASSAEQIRDLLVQQVVSQVRWHESVERLIAAGCGALVEIGPGKVLSGLAKRMDGAPAVLSVDQPEDVTAALNALGRGVVS